MDFLDPFNMLSVWISGGRHSWSNPDFDTKVKEAAEFLGAPEERIKMFQDAERILVSGRAGGLRLPRDAGSVHQAVGEGRLPEAGQERHHGLHWPGYTTMDTVPEEIYVSSDAPDRG